MYDYKQVITDVVDMHYPITEMCCESKISCIAWNPYHKNELVSSDYEGIISMWDPFTAKRVQVFQVQHFYVTSCNKTIDMVHSKILHL